MKKPVTGTPFLLCLLLFFSQLVNASPALFKIQKGELTSYVFGTVHVGTPDMAPLPNHVFNAIDQSDKVIVEVDLSALHTTDIQKISRSFMLLPKGQQLTEHLSEEHYQKLKRYFLQAGIDIAHFHQHRPWAVMLTLLQLEYKKLGFSEQYGIDKQVLTYANSKQKQIIGLETLEQQLTMLSALEKLNHAMFQETFKHLNDIEFYFVDLVQAWKKGDMKALQKYYELSFDDSKYGQYSEQVMLIERNHQWMNTLVPVLEKQRTFIAVGALHLPQQDGLLRLLEQAGFKVTKLSNEAQQQPR